MLSDSLRSLPVFEKVRKRFDARDTELLRKGVDVSLTSPALGFVQGRFRPLLGWAVIRSRL